MQSKRSRLYNIWSSLSRKGLLRYTLWEKFTIFLQDTGASYSYPKRLAKLNPHQLFGLRNFQWIDPIHPSKLTARQIAFCLESELSQRQLARLFKVSQSTICRAIRKAEDGSEKA